MERGRIPGRVITEQNDGSIEVRIIMSRCEPGSMTLYLIAMFTSMAQVLNGGELSCVTKLWQWVKTVENQRELLFLIRVSGKVRTEVQRGTTNTA